MTFLYICEYLCFFHQRIPTTHYFFGQASHENVTIYPICSTHQPIQTKHNFHIVEQTIMHIQCHPKSFSLSQYVLFPYKLVPPVFHHQDLLFKQNQTTFLIKTPKQPLNHLILR